MIQHTEEIQAGWCVVAVRGRADAEAADELEEALKAALKQNSKVAADFSGLDYISSAGLRAVLQAARAAQTLKAEFAICRLSPSVKKVSI
jgi:anti-sigma B factor antagonist